jgi:hypothetical protein
MRKLILLTSCVSIAWQTKAQVSVAPEIGVNLSSVSVARIGHNQNDPAIGNIKSRAGLRIGVNVNVPVGGNGFFIQSGIFAPFKGHRYSTFNSLYGRTEEYRRTTKPVYVEIPLHLGYDCRISKVSRIFFTAGIYGGYVVSETSYQDSLIDGFLLSGGSTKADIKNFDFGTAFSAGYKLGRRAFARVQYSLGLKNIAKDESLEIGKQSLSFTIGYAISVK